MSPALYFCLACDADASHTWHPARDQWLCDGCGIARWPAEQPVDDPVRAVGSAPSLAAVGPIALPPVAPVVTGTEPPGVLPAPWLPVPKETT